ncbi:TadE/TadG family type IV pilus assembly protein [Rhizobium mongolense]|uniref:TadE/TadG family type IV pilus assembly protein n=1 Tax=Rhizobium mongolense TaxID=57676 RepID=UPI00160D94E0|nr:TadE/TadG family type IV pilus assembly protein [Rhizobium mongolense]
MLSRVIRRFWNDHHGYVIALTLVAMPLLLGFSLLVIDVGRGNNLHTDLQNAVDALALAGARELDGSSDSITRAEAAMSNLVKNQARFSNGGPVLIEADEVEWYFLTKIPASDDTRIDAAWIDNYKTNDGADAIYVMVASHERPMTTLFPLPVGLTKDTVDFRASAVATYEVAACDVTPIFICNPYEAEGEGAFQERFANGDLYARAITMNMLNGSNAAAGPGNFGFLAVSGSGANVLRDALATNSPGACYSRRNLITEPGQQTGPVEQGINVRFDIYAGSMNSYRNQLDFRPAANVRKAAQKPDKCDQYKLETDSTEALELPSGAVSQTLPGGTLHIQNWQADLQDYWKVNHPVDVANDVVQVPNIPKTSYPGQGTPTTPSRYDIYNYEIAQNLLSGSGHTSPNGNIGAPQCYSGPAAPAGATDRRIIFAAVVNCNAAKIKGRTDVAAGDIEGFTSMFVTKPVDGDSKLSLEIIDITGNKGRGTLDTFIREEAYLVR